MNNELNNKSYGFWDNLIETIKRLFSKKNSGETYVDQRVEAKWERDYKNISDVNYTEIFSSRLKNYVLSGSSITSDDEQINICLQRCMDKAGKWVSMAIGIGRCYLVPYIIGDIIYTDIIPQSRAVITSTQGDDILGFASISDVRNIEKKWYIRWTDYEYDPILKTFTIENKATTLNSRAEVPLSIVPEWKDIQPYISFSNIERPLFGYVDSPKDNRNTDKLQGASITLGCAGTIDEILKNNKQFMHEYDGKEIQLGINKLMMDSERGKAQGMGGERAYSYVMFNGVDTNELFQVFSPDIRDQSYINRDEAVKGRLEKQVGTSNGILTHADTAMATATQVRRAMFDTTAMINEVRRSIDVAARNLCYTYEIYLSIIGIPYNKNYSIKSLWSTEYMQDDMERFDKVSRAHTSGVASDVELRREVYPNETPEEAEAAIEKIKSERPDPLDYMVGRDGGDDVSSYE